MMHILSYFSLFFLLFDLAIPGLGVEGVGTAVLSAIISGVVLFLSPQKKNLNLVLDANAYLIYIYITLAFFVVFRIYFFGNPQTSYLNTMIKSTVTMIASLLYLAAFYDTRTVIRLFNVFFFNAIICFVVGTYTELTDYISIFKHGDANIQIGSNPYRNSFLSGSGYFGIAAAYSIAIAFFSYYITTKNRKNIFDFIKLGAIMSAGILAGRVTVIAILVTLLFLLLFQQKIKFTALLVSLLLLFLLILRNTNELEAANDWINDMFFNEEGLITGSASAQQLDEMYFMPKEDTFLFGDGRYTTENGGYYMHTDSGYMRQLLFGGIFFLSTVLLIIPSLYLKNKSKIFLFLIFPVALLLHYKGNTIYNNPAVMPLIFIISFYFYISHQYEKSKNNPRQNHDHT